MIITIEILPQVNAYNQVKEIFVCDQRENVNTHRHAANRRQHEFYTSNTYHIILHTVFCMWMNGQYVFK